MIPQTTDEFLGLLEEQPHPSYTYKMDVDSKRISGFTDGQDAMKQAIYKRLQTPRGRYAVYSPYYGLDYEDFFGMPLEWVAAVLPDKIKESLSFDDRIREVSGFDISFPDKRRILVKFKADTDFGVVNDLEVTTNV